MIPKDFGQGHHGLWQGVYRMTLGLLPASVGMMRRREEAGHHGSVRRKSPGTWRVGFAKQEAAMSNFVNIGRGWFCPLLVTGKMVCTKGINGNEQDVRSRQIRFLHCRTIVWKRKIQRQRTHNNKRYPYSSCRRGSSMGCRWGWKFVDQKNGQPEDNHKECKK